MMILMGTAVIVTDLSLNCPIWCRESRAGSFCFELVVTVGMMQWAARRRLPEQASAALGIATDS